MRNRKPRSQIDHSLPEASEEGFLRRWFRRKALTRSGQGDAEAPTNDAEVVPPHREAIGQEVPVEQQTDAVLPPIASLDEESDLSGFMSRKVSDELRRIALRKLFHLPKFNVRDGLDDYDDDYRKFEALGGVITADMRHQIERASEHAGKAEREERKVAKASKETNSEQTGLEEVRVARTSEEEEQSSSDLDSKRQTSSES